VKIFLLTVLAARAAFGFAAESNLRSEEALRESVMRLASGDVTGAVAQARLSVDADPRNPRPLQQLARAANAALDFTAAEAAATNALALGPSTPAVLCLRSEARAGRGDYQGAYEDAQTAARMNPDSAAAALRVAVAKEGLRRPPEETLSDYARAAAFDSSLAPMRDAAILRLAPPGRPRRGLGRLLILLALAGFAGSTWGGWRRPPPAPLPPPKPTLHGSGRLAPKEALRRLAESSSEAADPDGARALAESLYERVTGRPAYPAPEATIARSLGRFTPASSLNEALPLGIDAFFARALHPDPARRFRTGGELALAFRDLVSPPVE
jgi:tetratricopeptide (TPR) repeat protein